jgi:hypothetical protein
MDIASAAVLTIAGPPWTRDGRAMDTDWTVSAAGPIARNPYLSMDQAATACATD